MKACSFTIGMPEWYAPFCREQNPDDLRSEAERLAFTVELSRRNVETGSGGPFGAAIFCNHTHKLLAAGVNLVTPHTTSLAHAECVSIGIAQQSLGQHDLSAGGGDYTLYCSAQPCIMCFGAIWWSGIRRVVCAARAEDVESLTGFFEGPVPQGWEQLLAERSPLPAVEVRWGSPALRENARSVLKAYKDSGAPIYNAGA
ncbi:MAG TPA: nucleoside deaminase [Bdellovibrionota bacterium]|jgi:tRNA(Arg) A34 adenosine deaminase TadA|nr:nucleoside deaminase [Bdellovibrionota bacterium]